jgi:hypothetical protein
LALAWLCVMALWLQRQQQDRDRLVAGEVWQEHGLVFASRVGTPLSANNVIRAFRIITKKAGLGENWVPREMRHTFVSVLSANGVSLEGIALLVGHDPSATTETVYRHEIRPALTEGAEVMDKIFGLAPGLCLSRVERYVGPGDSMAGCVHRGRVCGVGPMRPRPQVSSYAIPHATLRVRPGGGRVRERVDAAAGAGVLLGLLSRTERKNGWTLAEFAEPLPAPGRGPSGLLQP